MPHGLIAPVVEDDETGAGVPWLVAPAKSASVAVVLGHISRLAVTDKTKREDVAFRG
jgi:hypothetical protein